MNKKKLKKLLYGGFIGLVVVFALVYVFLYVDFGTGEQDVEVIKANGGYELLKSDLVAVTKCKDSQAASIADMLFEDVGIEKYEGIENGGTRGNYTILADGYRLDSFIQAGIYKYSYIGNAIVYVNKREAGGMSTQMFNVVEYSYEQYKTLVEAFAKGCGIDVANAKNIYETLTLNGILAFNNVKKGNLKDLGLSGFFGYEGSMPYFMTLNATQDSINKIYVVCDAFGPMEVYSSSGKPQYSLNEVKVMAGTRQGIANVMSYRIKTALDMDVTFPNALTSGDDSWLMVKNGDIVYLEVRGEIRDSKGNSNTKDFCIKIISGDNELIFVSIDGKTRFGS